jgi:hypothetical protein
MPPFTTPIKTSTEKKCPGAPIKKPKSTIITKLNIVKQLF